MVLPLVFFTRASVSAVSAVSASGTDFKLQDYIALTETFAEGLYTELDFRNEALNALRMEERSASARGLLGVATLVFIFFLFFFCCGEPFLLVHFAKGC